MKRRLMLYLLTVVMLLSVIPCAVSAQNDVLIDVPISIRETNGVEVSDFVQMRGIPFKKGEITDKTELNLVDAEGNSVPFSYTPIKFYDDGSVEWMRITTDVALRPYEIKNLHIKKGASKSEKKVLVNRSDNSIHISNDNLSLKLGYKGIEDISAQKFMANLYVVTDGEYHYMKSNEVDIIHQSDFAAKVRISGPITYGITGEITVMLSALSKTAKVEYRITSQRNVTIQGTGLEISGMTDTERNEIITDDYIEFGDIGLVSPDNTKFRGAVSKTKDTGFIYKGDKLYLAPIVNNTNFVWYDGVSRTNKLYICLDQNTEEYVKTASNPPQVIVPSEQFVKSGMIEGNNLPPAAERMLESMRWASDKLDNRFEAGSIPYDIDSYTETTSTFFERNGENEFYLGYGYMATGDPVLYELITDSALSWADVVIYKGGYSEIYGANRYYSDSHYGQSRFFTSHPYYGDLSGLYMAYLISGDEYLRDVFKVGADFIYRQMYALPNSGAYYPRRWDWPSTVTTPTASNIAESRYMIQARCMYFAYELFGDEKYHEAALDIVNWADKTQTDRGFWYQAYYDNGLPYTQSGQPNPAAKNYIYLYGIRGITELQGYVDTKQYKKVITSCADFLCDENEKFGQGLWHPFGDSTEYEVNEDNTRGKSPMSDIMAVDVLFTAYNVSNNERYLENMLSLLEAWLCAQTPGGSSAHKIGAQGYPTGISNAMCQNLTFLRHCADIADFISKNRDYVTSLGYENLVIAFGKNAEEYNKSVTIENYEYPEVFANAYMNGEEAVIFGMNVTGNKSGDYDKNIVYTIAENALWQGMTNTVSTPYSVQLNEQTKQFDFVGAIKRPIYINELSKPFEAEITEYTSDRIVIEFKNMTAVEFTVKDGRFNIDRDSSYNVSKRTTATGAKVVISRGGNVRPDENNNLIVNINVADKNSDAVADYLKRKGINIPLGDISGNEINAICEKLYGIMPFPKTDEMLSSREICDETFAFISENGKEILANLGIQAKKTEFVDRPLDDKDAVKRAADALAVEYNGELLASDVRLAKKSLYDTDVSWKTSNENVLSNDGKLFRNNIDTSSITLTATVTKNNEQYTREFDIPLKPLEAMNWRTSIAFGECKYDIEPQTDNFDITFTVVPDRENVNALVGLTQGSLNPTAMSQLPVIVRFSPDGFIDAYDHTGYKAETQIPYKGGVEYNFSMTVDIKTQSYDIWIEAEGLEKTCIAKEYRFRMSAPSPETFDAIYLPAALDNNCFSMTKNSLSIPEKEDMSPIDKEAESSGMIFGKYVESNITLPPVDDNNKLKWLCTNADIDNESGRVTVHQNGTAWLYRVIDNDGAVSDILDIQKRVGIFSNDELPSQTAERMLRKIGYILNK